GCSRKRPRLALWSALDGRRRVRVGVEAVEGSIGQRSANSNHFPCPVKIQAAARRTRYLDQQVGWVGRQRMAGERGLGDVERSVDHLEAAQFRNSGHLNEFAVTLGYFPVRILRPGIGAESTQHGSCGWPVEQRTDGR